MRFGSLRHQKRRSTSMTEIPELILGILKGPNDPSLRTRKGKERGFVSQRERETRLDGLRPQSDPTVFVGTPVVVTLTRSSLDLGCFLTQSGLRTILVMDPYPTYMSSGTSRGRRVPLRSVRIQEGKSLHSRGSGTLPGLYRRTLFPDLRFWSLQIDHQMT